MNNNTALDIFQYQQQDVRIAMQDGEPRFVISDVCKILEIANPSQAAQSLDDDEKGICNVYTLGGNQAMLCANESGVYHLIFISRKSEAKAFRRWITDEVLPSIRRTGSYSAHPQLIQPLQAKDLQQVLGNPQQLRQSIETLERNLELLQVNERLLYPGQSPDQGERIATTTLLELTGRSLKGTSLEDRVLRFIRKKQEQGETVVSIRMIHRNLGSHQVQARQIRLAARALISRNKLIPVKVQDRLGRDREDYQLATEAR